jgi:peptidoglycan/xylan/chitin deacetylase (PgdA/CDA1 family)
MSQILSDQRPGISEEFSIPAALSHSSRFVETTPYQKLIGKGSRFLARNFATKKLQMHNTRPMISFTFDDVPVSACNVGTQILERHGARGTFYIAGAGCGKTGPVGLLASIEQIRAVWLRGHEIGCQTYLHSAVSRLCRSELETECFRNQSALRMIDERIEVRNFAYPYGDLSFGARRYLEMQYDSCRSVDHGINYRTANLGSLKSWALESSSIDRKKIAALIADTIRCNGWLIFVSHDIGEQPSRYGIVPDLLEWAVVVAKQSGCLILPVAEGLKYAGGAYAEDISSSAMNPNRSQ